MTRAGIPRRLSRDPAWSRLASSALALYEPPYFAGSDGTEHLTTLERMLAAGQLHEATRYNLTAIIGLPAEAVDEIAQAPWWPGLVAVAPTLIYDHKASNDIETDPDWRSRWAAVTVPTAVYSGDQTFPRAVRGRRRRRSRTA